MSILKLISQLQAEGKTAIEQKLLLLDMKSKAVHNSDGTISDFAEGQSDEALKALINENKESMEEVITYLTKNKMELDAKIQGSDPLQKLVRLGRRELSVAYDQLIGTLTRREE